MSEAERGESYVGKGVDSGGKSAYGQVDKGGAPYILHPIRVMLACEGEKEKIVALLHDTLEDTALTAATYGVRAFRRKSCRRCAV